VALEVGSWLAEPFQYLRVRCCGGQVVIGASVVVAGAYALKQLVGPYAAKVYRKVYGIDETPEQSKQRAEDRRTADLVATAIQSQVHPPMLP
jgi:hypothetical protein